MIKPRSLVFWGGCLGSLLTILFLFLSSVQTDTIWANEVAKRMLAGGDYVHDFFENNPPLIFFLHAISRMFASILHIPPVFMWYSFVIAGSNWSLYKIYSMLKKPLIKDPVLLNGLIVGILLAYFVVPMISFAQREQVMLLMTLPYFISIYVRLLNNNIATWRQVKLGLIAGIGFGLKPHFFVPLLLVEVYYAIKQRDLFSWARLDFCCLIGFQCIYMLLIAWLTPTYFTDIFPLALVIYTNVSVMPFDFQLFVGPMLYVYAVIAWGIIASKRYKNFQFTIPFFVILCVGFALTFLVQRKGFAYHAMPMLGTATIASAVILIALYRTQKTIAKFQVSHMAYIFQLLAVAVWLGYGQVFIMVYDNVDCRLNVDRCIVRVIPNLARQGLFKNSYFAFTRRMAISMSPLYYSDMAFTSRFSSMWLEPMLSGEYGDRAKKYVRDMMVEDFITNKPESVLVDKCNYRHGDLNLEPYDYLSILKEDPKFMEAWKHYHLLKVSVLLDDCIFPYVRREG